MIIKNSGLITGNNHQFCFSILLIEQWNKESIEDAVKVLKPRTPIIVSKSTIDEKKIVYKHRDDNFITLIVSSEKSAFCDRLILSYEMSNRIETHVHQISKKDILLKAGEIINDAFMLSTERIIKDSKNHG